MNGRLAHGLMATLAIVTGAVAIAATLEGAPRQEASDGLLPPTPAGWRFERIELPPAFAPDMPYRGFEELRFAPGMFEPASDSYFSYILALELEGDVRVDTEFVTTFLDSYYRGLCKAVAESRTLDLDLARIAIDVEERESDFLATVEMFDVFVTGKPMTLTVELHASAAPRATHLLAVASPKPPDAPVWTTLRDLVTAWHGMRPPPVYLNHVYFTPDEATYAAIAASDELRDLFAIGEQRTTTRADMSYTGAYFYGDRTYFEFLKPGGAAADGTGIAFGIEVPGGTTTVTAALRKQAIPTAVFPVSRDAPTGVPGSTTQVPWFTIAGIQGTMTSIVTLFALEYDPRFLEQWHGDLAPALGGLARGRVLDRYAAKITGEVDPDRLFGDITDVVVEVRKVEGDHFEQVFDAFGYVVEQTATGRRWHGPQYSIELRATDAPRGVTALGMRLTRAVDPRTISLGSMTLRLHRSTARLEVND